MKKNLTQIFALFVILTGFYACEEDIDLFAEHERLPVVFALLDQSQPVQYFRINPTFIGEGDAREVAGNASLTNYAPGEIVVKLIDVDNDLEYTAQETTEIPLDPDGIFSTTNLLYKLSTPVTIIDSTRGIIENSVIIAGNFYRLEITEVSTGKKFTSEIQMGDYNLIELFNPGPKGDSASSRIRGDWMRFWTGAIYVTNYPFEFQTGPLAERFAVDFDYYYTDTPGENKNSKDKFVDINAGEINSIQPRDGVKNVTLEFDGRSFYTILANKLDESTTRTGQRIDVKITVAGQDLDDYLRVQDAALTGISQEIANFSNIENGLGVFSFRMTKTFTNLILDDISARHVFESDISLPYFTCARHGSQSDSQGIIICR